MFEFFLIAVGSTIGVLAILFIIDQISDKDHP